MGDGKKQHPGRNPALGGRATPKMGATAVEKGKGGKRKMRKKTPRLLDRNGTDQTGGSGGEQIRGMSYSWGLAIVEQQTWENSLNLGHPKKTKRPGGVKKVGAVTK